MHAAVGRAVAPVVDDVVADIEPARVVPPALVEPAGEAPVAAGAVGEQVVVEAADVAADAGREAVLLAGAGVILVVGDVQRLGDERPLERDVLGRCAS